MSTPSTPVNFLNCRFRVEIDGIQVSDFAEVILPEAQADIAEYREGNDRSSRKVAGAIRFSNLVLRRGVSQSNELYQWWKSVADGTTHRRNVGVVLLNEQQQEVKRWGILRAWPARYAISPLVARDGDVTLMESLECATEGFQLNL